MSIILPAKPSSVFYSASGVRLTKTVIDAPTNYFTSTSLTGASSTMSAATVSFWVKFTADNGVFTAYIFSTEYIFSRETGGLFSIRRDRTSQKVNVFFATSGASDAILLTANTTFGFSDTWKHVLCSWDVNAAAGARTTHMYVNDVDVKVLSLDVGSAFSVNMQTITDRFYLGATGSSQIDHELSEFFIHQGTCMDLSVVANRRKFISATKRPVFLGSDGSRPFGSQPLIYLKGSGTGFNVNSGSGGNFTTVGTPTTPTTTPST